jgi:hypothetical protein
VERRLRIRISNPSKTVKYSQDALDYKSSCMWNTCRNKLGDALLSDTGENL